MYAPLRIGRFSAAISLALAIVLGSLESTYAGVSGELLVTMTNPSGVPNWSQGFGTAIAGVGDYVVVGVPYDDPDGLGNAGSLMVFDASTGDFLQRILNPNPLKNNHFGKAIAAVNGQILAGSQKDYSYGTGGRVYAGRAFLFDVASGDALLTISSPDPSSRQYFGNATAALGDNLLVGEYLHSLGSNVTVVGSTYLYDGTTGALLREYANPDPHHLDWFGTSVASIGTEIVVVGAPGFDNGLGTNANLGRVYLFDVDSGALLATLDNPTPDSTLRFGSSVTAVGDNFAVSGMAGDKVYLYDGKTFELLRTIDDPESTSFSGFGRSLACLGDDLLVGAYESENVYVFDGDTGSLLLSLDNPDPTYESFGKSVSSLNGNILVGANDAAYVFRGLVPEPGSLAMWGGLSIFGLAARRRRRRAA